MWKIHMLFTGREVRMGRNCARGLKTKHNTTCIILLVLLFAVCSAARFPFHRQAEGEKLKNLNHFLFSSRSNFLRLYWISTYNQCSGWGDGGTPRKIGLGVCPPPSQNPKPKTQTLFLPYLWPDKKGSYLWPLRLAQCLKHFIKGVCWWSYW